MEQLGLQLQLVALAETVAFPKRGWAALPIHSDRQLEREVDPNLGLALAVEVVAQIEAVVVAGPVVAVAVQTAVGLPAVAGFVVFPELTYPRSSAVEHLSQPQAQELETAEWRCALHHQWRFRAYP